MVTQVPLLSEPLPDPLSQTSEEFESSATKSVSELNPAFTAVNALALELNEIGLNVEAASEGIANAVWVSGTTYTAGQVRWSPITGFTYRRKTNGAGTTDPSADPTNWALLTKTESGGSDTTSSAVDIALTSTSGRLQVITMTAAGKKVTLPSATSLAKGAPIFVIKNSGLYRFGVRKNGGVFICYVNPGQVIAFGCSDTSTSAGVWTISGESVSNIYDGNSAEVLSAADSRFIAVAMLSATKAICAYKNNSTGFLWAVILNFGSASGTAAAINAEAVENISIAAQTSSQATVVFQLTASSNVKGFVLDVSGNTITPGTVATIHTAAGTSGARGTGITPLSSTKLLCIYAVSGGTNIQERVLDISGSAITPGTAANADTTAIGNSIAIYSQIEAISATKAVMVTQGTSFQFLIRLQSISGSTPTPTGTVLSIAAVGTSTPSASFGFCVLNSSRAIVIRNMDPAFGDFHLFLIDISGTTPTLVATKHIAADIAAAAANIVATRLDDNHVYMSWTGGFSLGVDSMVLTITNDDQILPGTVSEKNEPGITSAFGYLACDALDTTHVMQVCRNASSFLSAKTIEVS